MTSKYSRSHKGALERPMDVRDCTTVAERDCIQARLGSIRATIARKQPMHAAAMIQPALFAKRVVKHREVDGQPQRDALRPQRDGFDGAERKNPTRGSSAKTQQRLFIRAARNSGCSDDEGQQSGLNDARRSKK